MCFPHMLLHHNFYGGLTGFCSGLVLATSQSVSVSPHILQLCKSRLSHSSRLFLLPSCFSTFLFNIFKLSLSFTAFCLFLPICRQETYKQINEQGNIHRIKNMQACDDMQRGNFISKKWQAFRLCKRLFQRQSLEEMAMQWNVTTQRQ